jgi:hypothetical protein
VTGCGRIGEGGEDGIKEWMKRGRKSSWEGEQWNVAQEKKGESEEGKDRDKRIVMVKLVIQE